MSLATSASIAGAGNLSVTSSRNSMSVGPILIEETYNQVPFQELIETGLEFMRQYPPRSLMDLAKKYYKKEWTMGDEVVNISLLQNPPNWSLAPTAKADWVLKQRVRQELGLKPTSRKDRRKKAQLAHSKSTDEQPSNEATPLVDKDYLKEYQWTLAVIAVGYGPGPEAVERKRQKRRMMKAAVAIGVVAIVMGIAYQYQSQKAAGETKTADSSFPIGAKKLLVNNPSPEVGLEAPSVDIKASSSADGLVANTEVDLEAPVLEVPSVDIIASSSADGLVANTTVEVESPSTPATFTHDSESQGQKDASFAAQGKNDVPIDAPSIAKVESKLVPLLDKNTNSRIKLQVPTEQMMKRMLAPEAKQPVVSSSHSVPPPIIMLRKVAQSIYRFLYHIRTKWVGKLRHFVVRHNDADGEDRIPFGQFMGSLRNLWEKLPSAPKDVQRV
jgi:hypothetical protein